MIVGVGIDIVEVERIVEAFEKYGERFERRVFTEEEIDYCRGSSAHEASRFAARWAAKEAFAKALGTGFAGDLRWTDIGVSRESSGRPVIVLTGEAARLCAGLIPHLSLSHTAHTATAMVVLERPDAAAHT